MPVMNCPLSVSSDSGTDVDPESADLDNESDDADCCGIQLFQICKCARKRGDPSSSCFRPFAQQLRSEVCTWHDEYERLDKLDQDRCLYEMLKQAHVPGHAVRYRFGRSGTFVCRDAFKRLCGVGTVRFNRLNRGIIAGQPDPPMDLR